MADEPMTDEQLQQIRQAHAETRAEMDAWYTAHPNPQWRREHPFDADSVVANTHIYITIPALLAEVDRLRAALDATHRTLEAWQDDYARLLNLLHRLSESLPDARLFLQRTQSRELLMLIEAAKDI